MGLSHAMQDHVVSEDTTLQVTTTNAFLSHFSNAPGRGLHLVKGTWPNPQSQPSDIVHTLFIFICSHCCYLECVKIVSSTSRQLKYNLITYFLFYKGLSFFRYNFCLLILISSLSSKSGNLRRHSNIMLLS